MNFAELTYLEQDCDTVHSLYATECSWETDPSNGKTE
jgi:hypothetical protein